VGKGKMVEKEGIKKRMADKLQWERGKKENKK